jgi:protein arginine kinase activator
MAENLKCSICGQLATVHLTQIVNNKIHKVDLCESCAQKKGVTDPEGFSLADLMSNAPLAPAAGESQVVCPSCGQGTADFRSTGRLGCAKCYEVFKDLVLPVLEDMHAGTTHKGKVPTVALNRQSIQLQLKNLQEALARAIEEEAYEQAAKFRDQIKAIQATEELEVASK